MGSGSDGVKISQEELTSTLTTLAQLLDLFSNFETRLGNMASNIPPWSHIGDIDHASLQQTLEILSDSHTELAEEITLDLAAFFNKVEDVRDSWAELDAALATLQGED